MVTYKFLKKKTFEKIDRFESRINEEASKGWVVVNFTGDGQHSVAVLLKRER